METPPTKTKEKREYKPKNKSSAKKARGAFEFPDGGWECSKCQNYNFKGRKECNRCKKVRTTKDLSGKPAHLQKLNQDQKKDKVPDLTTIENNVEIKEKPLKFKNLKVETNFNQDKTDMEWRQEC